MERGSPPPDRLDPDRPAVPGPQAPAPGPQAPAPGPETLRPGSQGPPAGPQAPPGPEGLPGYGGPVPPGGWQQPIARPEGGWVGQPLAGWGSRVGATIVDGLIVLVPAAILFFVLVAGAVGVTGGDEDASVGALIGASILWFLVVGAIALLYAPTLMARQGSANGQTLGKQMFGIRVVRNSGESMSFAWAALREVVIKLLAVGIASSIIPVLPWLLDVLWPLWDDENRALHDLAVQTHVIRA